MLNSVQSTQHWPPHNQYTQKPSPTAKTVPTAREVGCCKGVKGKRIAAAHSTVTEGRRKDSNPDRIQREPAGHSCKRGCSVGEDLCFTKPSQTKLRRRSGTALSLDNFPVSRIFGDRSPSSQDYTETGVPVGEGKRGGEKEEIKLVRLLTEKAEREQCKIEHSETIHLGCAGRFLSAGWGWLVGTALAGADDNRMLGCFGVQLLLHHALGTGICLMSNAFFPARSFCEWGLVPPTTNFLL